MAYWILKTEPSSYAFADLEREGRTVWDGVANAQALIHIRAMHSGDEALIYHSGDERAAVGLARIVSEPYADPQLDDPKRVVVDVAAVRRLSQLINLSAIKARPEFADFGLVRQSRLSVVPVSADQWQSLLHMAGES
ncbi:MAG TPA: EVE domain-containing protein [Herpetosiphonaceae bacterium]